MADVRSLLRQQRAARRIEHPTAAYTEAGRLLCTLCREQIKAETLWDSHVQGEDHRRRLRSADEADGQARGDAAAGSKQKRKLDADGEDAEMADAVRRKRSRGYMTEAGHTNGSDREAGKEGATEQSSSKEATLTPPALARRTSTTPSQGVELQIPSRPATPGGAPPVPSQAAGPTTSLPSRQASHLAAADRPSSAAAQVDEAEWEAFQADIAAISAPYDRDAVISAPAMTAEESAAAAAAEAQTEGSRKPQADVDIEDEREEATRAREDEFEEMQELEERVKRLKEKREALRKRGESHGQASPQEKAEEAAVADGDAEEEDEDDEEDDEDEDDWDGFRFRAP